MPYNSPWIDRAPWGASGVTLTSQLPYSEGKLHVTQTGYPVQQGNLNVEKIRWQLRAIGLGLRLYIYTNHPIFIPYEISIRGY
jgi:hypothetical protein